MFRRAPLWIRASAILVTAAALASVPARVRAQDPSMLVLEFRGAADAWQALQDGRLEEAAAAFERAMASDPRNASMRLGAGVAARRLGQAARARDLFTRALDLDPGLTPAAMFLGLVVYDAGDLDEAIRIYERALGHAPDQAQMQARLAQWKKERDLHERFQQAQGSHFTVLFEGPAEQELAQRAVDILESAYWRLGSALFAYPIDVVTVVLYTQEQFRDITRSPAWSGGLFDGRIRVPVRGALADPGELERVLTHEYTHAVVRSVAPTGAPTWLNEGLAVVFETGGLDLARREVAKATAFIPLAELQASFGSLPADRVPLAYAESAMAVQAIIDKAGTPALMALLGDVGTGIAFDSAFANRVGVPFTEFARDWQAALRR